MQIIAAGHICLDITPVFSTNTPCSAIGDLLEPGKLIQMKGADVHTGGSVANTGLALKLLGADVTLMGKVGNDAFGGMVRDILAQHGADGLIVDESSATSYSVVLAVPGVDRIFLHDPGANNTFSDKDIPEVTLENAVLFHFGYPPLMKRMYENDGSELAFIFRRMKAKGIATSLDMAAVDPTSEAGRADWRKILENVLPYTDFGGALFYAGPGKIPSAFSGWRRYDTAPGHGAGCKAFGRNLPAHGMQDSSDQMRYPGDVLPHCG